MILARNSITLHHLRDITTVVWYYKLQASTASPPAKPTTETPSGWSTTEPSYTEGSTNSLYVVQKTTFSDGTFEYSDVSLSTSYEAAKAAYNKSVQAQTTANAAQESIDNLEIGGRNLLPFKDCPSVTLTRGGITLTKEEDGWIRVSGTRSGTSLTTFTLWQNPDGDTYTAPINNNVPQDGNTNQFTLSVETEGTPFLMGTTYTNSSHIVAYGSTSSTSWRIGGINGTSMTGVFPTYMSVIRYYIGASSTGTVNGRFRVKLERGGKATNWTPAPEDVDSNIQQAVDNLEIGGRNLLLNTTIRTANMSKIRANASFTLVSEDGIACYKTTGNNTAHLFNGTDQWDCTSEKLKANTTYTYSAWIKTDKAQSFGYMQYGHFNVSNSASTKSDKTHEDIAEKRIYKPETIEANQWTKISITFTTNNLDGSSFGVYPVYNTGTETNLFIYGMKLEKGAKATDWTPAPEDAQTGIDALQPELIVGTHGTTATATWTGTSTVLTEIKAGTRIQYKLSSAGASNVTLNLTLKDGTTTGAKSVYFLNTTRLGTQYGVNAIVDLIYDGSAWRVLNPYTNSNTVGTYGGAVKAGTNGVKNYSLVMRDTATTWVSLTTTAGTGATKSRYTGKLYPDKVMYMGSNAAYASGVTTGTCYEALAINLQYSTNCGSTLVSGRAVYLVGTLDSDGLFTLDATWWTQTIPTTEDGKTYIYLGLAYSTTNIYLVPDNPMYQYYEGAFRTLREIEEMEAAKTATNYLAMDNTGIMVADMSGGTQYTPRTVPSGVKNAFIDNDSFNVRDGKDVLASFGETSHVGKLGEAHLEQTATGVDVVDSNGTNKVSFGAQSEATVWEEESHMVAGYISDGGTIVNASTEFSLPAELAASQNMTLTIGSSSYTIPTGQTYSYTGSNYSIAYDGSRSVVVTNLSSSTITAVLRYPATQPTDYGITAVTPANTRIKTRVYANDTLLAEGGVYANRAGNFGLYDAKHAKWLIFSDAGGNVNVPSLAPKLLYASKIGAPSSQNVWNYMNIQLKQWAVIAIRAVVQNCMQYLIFFTGAPGNQYISDRPADVYIRGGFKVDWDAGRIYVRWVNGNSTTYQNVYFDRVYGLIRK